jgi:hypothetical protein
MKGCVVWLYVISVESGWLHKVLRLSQGLLELPRTEGKLQSCLELRIFQNPFNKDKSVGLWDIPCTKKGLKFELVVELAKLNLTYITVIK